MPGGTPLIPNLFTLPPPNKHPMLPLSTMQEASRLLERRILRTPLIYSPTFSQKTGCEVYLKLENLQRGGSFKVRGATYKLLKNESKIKAGVVAASAGNHAQGVALAAREAGVPATIVMPSWVSLAKQEATRHYGAEVILKGETLVESIAIAEELARDGKAFIHPFDDIEIIAGQGTIGLEIIEDLPKVDAIIVPVGGGGLIAGIASAVKAEKPGVRIVGVQAGACPSAVEALGQGQPVDVTAAPSLAEAISVTRVGDLTFPLVRDLVDEMVLVEEDEIAAAVLALLERKRVIAEGAGATPLAALLGPCQLPPKSRVVLVISGGNLDSLLLDRIIRKGMALQGRIMNLSLAILDQPGSLARVLGFLASEGANVLNIHHIRTQKDLPFGIARLGLELETRGAKHQSAILARLEEEGFTPSTP